MLDINNKNNFEQLPPLKQKCDVVNGTVKHQQHQQQQQQSIKLQGKYNDIIKTTTSKATTPSGAATTSTNGTKHYSGNYIKKHHHSSSSSIAQQQQHTLNIKNKSAAGGINPVSAANQQFFLIQAYKDQNFLKKECELARSQVVRLEAKERTKNLSTHSKELSSSSRCLRFEKANGGKEAASTVYNDDSFNNNSNIHTSAIGRKTETKPTTTASGRRFSISNSSGLSSTAGSAAAAANVIANGGGLGGNSNALPKINKFNCCNPPATQTLAGHQQQQQQQPQRGVGAFVRPTITTISLATPAVTTNNTNKFLKQSATKTTETANKYNLNNNNMQKHQQQQQQHPQQQCIELHDDDDIKYIDSDEPIVATGNSMNCQQRCCKEQQLQQQQQQQKSIVTGKAKVRPKSTIICSTNLQQQHNQIFEKVNSYRYGGGGGGGSSNTIAATDLNPQLSATANAALAERRRELKKTIDSNSIKASIEKFNSLSEQKRLPYATSNNSNNSNNAITTTTTTNKQQNSLRHHHHHHHLSHNIAAAAGNSGSTNNINIQHHRYSSDFSDTYNARLPSSVIGGGSLTRTATRNLNVTTSIVNKVVTNVYTAASASTSTSTSPVTIKAIRNLNTQSNQSSESSSPTHVSSSSSSPVQKTTLLQLRSAGVSERLKDNNNINMPTVSGITATTTANNSMKACTNPQVTSVTSSASTSAAAVSIESNDNKLSNNLCDIDDSARSSSSLRSALPPPSPTASRYWDRESNRTSSSTRNDDHTNSKPLDEKSEGLCGLRNIGNTCFMNSVIQCLSHTSELTKFLRTQNGVRSSPSSRDQQILYEFAKLIREMWTANVHSVTPMELKRAFSTKHRMYSDYNQQDAQEFLRFFLDSLHSALNTGVKGEVLKIDDNLSDNKKADLTWEWYSRHENSLIRDLFVGQLKSTLKCTTCGNASVTFDPFWDLSVSLPSSSRCKLDTCLDLFIREEVLDGDEMPTCSKCQTRRKCTKSFTIQRFPKYLVIHLKRFSETRWSKLSNIVEFPTGERELNMGPYGSNHSNNVYYSLYAISNHMGSTAGGHYVALCKHPVSKKWHEFNDNIVSDDLSENHLVSSSAYILFYERA